MIPRSIYQRGTRGIEKSLCEIFNIHMIVNTLYAADIHTHIFAVYNHADTKGILAHLRVSRTANIYTYIHVRSYRILFTVE